MSLTLLSRTLFLAFGFYRTKNFRNKKREYLKLKRYQHMVVRFEFMVVKLLRISTCNSVKQAIDEEKAQGLLDLNSYSSFQKGEKIKLDFKF